MASWRDYARAVDPAPETRANSANSANSPGLRPDPAPIGTNDTNGTASLSLPIAIAKGLVALPTMACPRDLNAARWPIAVAAAVKLGGDGWAAKAIALGWSDLDLFGVVACSPSAGRSPRSIRALVVVCTCTGATMTARGCCGRRVVGDDDELVGLSCRAWRRMCLEAKCRLAWMILIGSGVND